jgi:hypothetical protein
LFEFTKGPDAFPFVSGLGINDAPNAVLHSVDPLTTVLAAIRVGVSAFAVLLVKSVVALIHAAVLPHIVTKTVHNSVLKRALEVTTIGPLKAAMTAHLVI